MERIIPDLLLALQDLQNTNTRAMIEALADLDPTERRLMVQQVRRLYKALDVENQLTYGTQVQGGIVAGMRFKNAELTQILVDGPDCHEWRTVEQASQAA